MKKPNNSILVIEDDPHLAHMLATVLETADAMVTVSPNAEGGLRGFAQMRYSPAVVDVFMDGMGGLAAIEEMKRGKPGVPILAISGGWRGMSKTETLKAARKIGADAALAKPLDAEELIGAARGLMDGSWQGA